MDALPMPNAPIVCTPPAICCHQCGADELALSDGLYRWRDGNRYCWRCVSPRAHSDPTETLVQLNRCRRFKAWLKTTLLSYTPTDRISFTLLDPEGRMVGWVDFARSIGGWQPGQHATMQQLRHANQAMRLQLRLEPLNKLFGQ